ncbi:MAG: glycerol-3-phosphate acyltransferase [Anaerolineaceae bacterium]|nr:glycerol-3-phosphate acyltransferase [Anaerolineaceae bacterium]
MLFAEGLSVFILAYLAGSIPFGYLVVRLFNGRDVREVESGRTGGTNAFRAAGLGAGILTAVLDVLKGVASGWLVAWLAPGNIWYQVAAAVLVVIGHNYSIFLPERDVSTGRIRLRGGAGGAPALGGSIALWPSSGLIILPLAIFVFLFIGYASVTTISITVISTAYFLYLTLAGLSPWAYVIYGVLATVLVIWALRPNLDRLRRGKERVVGLRAYWMKKAAEKLGR